MATLIKILDKTKFQDKTVFAESAGEGGGSSLTTGLQAFYKLSDTSDSSGNNRTLTNNGNVSFASGKIGNAAVFDGSNWLGLSLETTPNYTFSAWFKPNTLDYTGQVEDSGRPVDFFGSLGPILQINPGEQWVYAHPNGNGFTDHFWPATANQWVHLAFSYNGSQTKLYQNNVLLFTSEDFVQQDFLGEIDLVLGAADGGSYMFYNGQIDAVGIWNRALSDAEVAALYNSGAGIELP